MKQWLQSLRDSYLVKQTLLLYGSQLVMTGFGVLAYILMAREMSKEDFGDREVIMKLAVFASGFFEFGILTAGARLLAIQPDKARERQLFSLMLWVALILLSLFALFLFAASFFVDALFQTSKPIGATLALFSLPLAFIVFKIYFQLLYQGTNEMLKLSFYNASVQIVFLALLAVLWWQERVTTFFVIAAYSLSSCVVALFLIAKGKPSMVPLGTFKAELWEEIKRYGAKFYIGRTLAVLTQNLDSLLLATFFTSVNVGVYSVMVFFVSPMQMFSDAYLVVRFKKLSSLEVIPTSLLKANALVLLTMSAMYLVAGHWLIQWLFPKYSEHTVLLYPLLLAMLLNGLSKPYNYFFSAKGMGDVLLRVALVFTASNLVMNFWLIPNYAEMGAAVAMLISMTALSAIQVFLYTRNKETVAVTSRDKNEQ
ncbi:MAG: oligosaccharide flippase family protein [Chloroherpetonaceae bacterium]